MIHNNEKSQRTLGRFAILSLSASILIIFGGLTINCEREPSTNTPINEIPGDYAHSGKSFYGESMSNNNRGNDRYSKDNSSDNTSNRDKKQNRQKSRRDQNLANTNNHGG